MAERTSRLMSKMPSSSWRVRHKVFTRVPGLTLLALVAALSVGCSKPVDVNSPQVRGIGYVRLEDVVKKHPLYGQLSQIDSNIDALSLRTLAPSVPKTGAEIARETTELNRELEASRERANRPTAYPLSLRTLCWYATEHDVCLPKNGFEGLRV